MMYFLFIFLAIHFILLLILQAGLMKALSFPVPLKDSGRRLLSVIVPYRNESSHLASLVQSLKAQEYEPFQVLLVNDHSNDRGEAYVRGLVERDDRFILLDSSGEGKKEALTTGIHAASGEVIVTTDADCTFGPEWLARINDSFSGQKIQLVFGAVVINPQKGFFSRLQSLEFLSVIGVGISAFSLGKPVYCNGANMAFRKDVFKNVDGYAGNLNVASGDDEFLLKKVALKFPDGISFLNSPETLVTTTPQATLRSFLHQRIRWAGKSKLDQGSLSRVLAVLIFAIQCSVIGAILALILGSNPGVIGYLLGGKVVLEFVILFSLSRHFGNAFRVVDFLILQFVYPVYVLYVGLAANFSTFEWKGRKYSYRATAH